MQTKNIMIVGTGGQGTLLASKLLGRVLIEKGYDVKVSEVHGMAQRGGSVVTYVKYGEAVYSPVIDSAEADIILSFEQLEAARWLSNLKPGGKILTNTQSIDPMPVITGALKYPENLVEKINDKQVDILGVDALSLAKKAGFAKAVNVVMIGVLANFVDGISREDWIEAIKVSVPAKALDVNLTAFELGYSAVNS